MPDRNETAEPAVRVTLETIYLKLLDVEKKVDPLPPKVADLESRLRAIERQVWMWVGAAAIGGGGIYALVERISG